MIKSFFTVTVASLMTTASFAQQTTSQMPVSVPVADFPELPIVQPSVRDLQKQGFFYIRFTAGEHDLVRAAVPLPGLGLGYRRLAGDGAADLSFTGLGIAERKNSKYFWTAPKASYYHYLQPNATKTLYIGAGLAWGGIGRQKDQPSSKRHEFIGIIPSATIGYEFTHKTSVLGFSELTISQPALAVGRKGTFPGPIAELSFGIGF